MKNSRIKGFGNFDRVNENDEFLMEGEAEMRERIEKFLKEWDSEILSGAGFNMDIAVSLMLHKHGYKTLDPGGFASAMMQRDWELAVRRANAPYSIVTYMLMLDNA